MDTTARRWILGLAGTAAAACVFFWSLAVHLDRACVEMDTPYLPLCSGPAAEPELVREQLRARIGRNPGDSIAWTKLLVSDALERSEGVLKGAAVVAPHNHNVSRRRAAQALAAGRLPEGVSLLVRIVGHRSSPDSARVLAQLAATPEGRTLLRPHLAQGKQWLPQVLAASYSLKMPPSEVLPLVAEALRQSALPDTDRQAYMRALKTGGYWLDAYGLWLLMHKDPVPLLYNGSFDLAFDPGGFDWEFERVPRSRTGVMVEQEALARRGQVLDVEFTGRSFTAPIVRQHVFASPGAYTMRGEYMALKLRSESGLAWSVVCTSGRRAVVARTAGLQDTGGLWKPLELKFTIPPDCGPVASLQLEPAAPYEAATGLKGRIVFDSFSLERATSSQ